MPGWRDRRISPARTALWGKCPCLGQRPLTLRSNMVPSRTQAIATVLTGLLAGAWLTGCDSGHNPTVRQRTLAAGGPSAPAEVAPSGQLPKGHPKVQRPPGTQAKSPLGPAGAEEMGSADRRASADKPAPLAPSEPPEANLHKPDRSPPAATGQKQVEPSAKEEGPLPVAAAVTETVVAPPDEAAPANNTAAAKPAKGVAPKESAWPQAAGESGDSASRHVQIGHLRLQAPRTWLRKKPPIDFILAEFALPRAPGDPEDAQLTVTAVGPNDPDRLNQLREELKKSSGQAAVEYLKVSGVEVILVDASANYGEMPGVFAPEVREGRYRVLNAIVPAGEKLYFVNCSGPEKTVGNYARQFREFLLGMKSADAP